MVNSTPQNLLFPYRYIYKSIITKCRNLILWNLTLSYLILL